jgi:hypothetical protein
VSRPELCPFCSRPAEFTRVRGREFWNMDCIRCDIRIEISDTALATDCMSPSSTLKYIHEQLKRVDRVWIDSADMLVN